MTEAKEFYRFIFVMDNRNLGYDVEVEPSKAETMFRADLNGSVGIVSGELWKDGRLLLSAYPDPD